MCSDLEERVHFIKSFNVKAKLSFLFFQFNMVSISAWKNKENKEEEEDGEDQKSKSQVAREEVSV